MLSWRVWTLWKCFWRLQEACPHSTGWRAWQWRSRCRGDRWGGWRWWARAGWCNSEQWWRLWSCWWRGSAEPLALPFFHQSESKIRNKNTCQCGQHLAVWRSSFLILQSAWKIEMWFFGLGELAGGMSQEITQQQNVLNQWTHCGTLGVWMFDPRRWQITRLCFGSGCVQKLVWVPCGSVHRQSVWDALVPFCV